MTARISTADFDEIIRADLPWAYEIGMHADAIGRGRAVLRLPFRPSMLRPGGVVSGPTIMALADACMFAVVLSAIGKIKLAVTTSFSINFLYRRESGGSAGGRHDAATRDATGGDAGDGALGGT